MSVQPDFGQQVPGTNLAEDPYAISAKWHAHKDYKKPFDYTLQSSGQRLLLQRLEMPDLIKQGIANELDFLTKGLMTNDKPAQSGKEAVSDVIAAADNFQKMEVMVNKVCTVGILKPQVYPVPTITRTENGKTITEDVPADKRQQGLFYVDNIPWPDREELFSVIFEAEGLSDFQQEQEHGVGNVADVQSVQLPANGPDAVVSPDNTQGVLPQ